MLPITLAKAVLPSSAETHADAARALTDIDLGTAVSMPYAGEDGIVEFALTKLGVIAAHQYRHVTQRFVTISWQDIADGAEARDTIVYADAILTLLGTLSPEELAAAEDDEDDLYPEDDDGEDDLYPEDDDEEDGDDWAEDDGPLDIFSFDRATGVPTVHYHAAVPDGRLVLVPAKDGLHILFVDTDGTALAATRFDPLGLVQPSATPQ